MATPKLAHRSTAVATPPVLSRPIPFYPARLSDQELDFLLEHMEEPPAVVLQGELPLGVNPTSIEHVLVPMYELEQLRSHRGINWAGFAQVRDVIVRYQEWQKFSKDIHAQGGPRHPSMYAYDSDGQITKGAPGTDPGEIVKTEILEDGTRRPLFLADLRRPEQGRKGPHFPWVKQRDLSVTDAVEHDAKKGILTCSICQHVVSYTASKGRVAMNLARGHMARHLKGSRKEPTRHRALYRREFPGS